MTLLPVGSADLPRAVERALLRKDFEKALALVHISASAAWRAASRQGQFCYGSRDLDMLCLAIGRRMAEGEPLADSKTPALDVFVASELYASGGHTARPGGDFFSAEGGDGRP